MLSCYLGFFCSFVVEALFVPMGARCGFSCKALHLSCFGDERFLTTFSHSSVPIVVFGGSCVPFFHPPASLNLEVSVWSLIFVFVCGPGMDLLTPSPDRETLSCISHWLEKVQWHFWDGELEVSRFSTCFKLWAPKVLLWRTHFEYLFS